MWQATHIQVTVVRAKGLLAKGKNGTNNCFVTIGLGKEKYQTSVKERADTNVNWNEECELKIPDHGNRAELVLTCLHRNNLGIDEFLGQVTQPLNEMDAYDRPRSRWFRLESKPGKEKKNKERGELEVRISFIVKSGSLTDLSKKDKHKSSIGQLATSVGGSLLSIGTLEKRKGIKKFAKSLGSKMHLHSKKKNKDGDDVSISGSFASIGTPTSSHGGSRRYGQRAGEADPGVISEDEDEFAFENLSHKSSGSSLNIRSGLQPPAQNYAPHTPSPLLGVNGKKGGKQLDEDLVIDPELEEIENDFSVRARTLPPPSKPPRTPQLGNTEPTTPPPPLATATATVKSAEKEPKLDEWEKKLYGKHLEIGSSDSLKRRSWEPALVPLPTTDEVAAATEQIEAPIAVANSIKTVENSSSSSSSSSEEDESDAEEEDVPEPVMVEKKPEPREAPQKPKDLALGAPLARGKPQISLLSPDTEQKDFNDFNASFAKFEQRNSSKIFDMDADSNKWNSRSFIAHEAVPQAPLPAIVPQALPRNRDQEADRKKAEEEAAAAAAAATAVAAAEGKRQAEADSKREMEEKAEEEKRRRAAEDARLEAELRLNEQRLHEEELALEEEMLQREEEQRRRDDIRQLEDEQKRREAKRREEDQRILNFSKRSTSLEDEDAENLSTPEQSPKEQAPEMREKRLGKFKYNFSKRDKHDDESLSSKSSERIIIGHEKAATHAERRSEMSAALSKKYEGKSREELMLIANGMENEALLQRQRVKELEDYLDNLLLRVMETHPKILQNPYSRTTSAKSG